MLVRGGRVQRGMRDFDAHGHLLANSGEVIFSASHLVSWAQVTLQVTSSHIGCSLDGRGPSTKIVSVGRQNYNQLKSFFFTTTKNFLRQQGIFRRMITHHVRHGFAHHLVSHLLSNLN